MELTLDLLIRNCVKDAVYEALQGLKLPQQEEVKAPASRKEVAKFLNISIPTLDGLLKRGEIKFFKIGGSIKIHWKEVERFVNERGLND